MDEATPARMTPLPRSGLGVDPPWLVMAPPGNPPIRIDLRMLDRVDICPPGDDDESASSDQPAHDPACSVLLACGELEIRLDVSDGPDAAMKLVRHAAPLTRASSDTPGDVENFVFVGDDAVQCRGDMLTIGALKFRISKVREYALRGANMPVGRGVLLQAALALLVVAASEQAAERNAPMNAPA